MGQTGHVLNWPSTNTVWLSNVVIATTHQTTLPQLAPQNKPTINRIEQLLLLIGIEIHRKMMCFLRWCRCRVMWVAYLRLECGTGASGYSSVSVNFVL